MAQLSTVICSILRDMIVAQHEANMYAITLEDVYKKNGRLEQFALPAVAMGEVELSIRYGVKDDSATHEQYEINYPQLRKISETISRQFAQAITDRVFPLLQTAYPYNGTDVDAKVLADFATNKSQQRKYSRFLSRKIHRAMQMSFSSLINEDGTLNENNLSAIVTEMCEAHIIGNEDLQPLLTRTGGHYVVADIRNAVRETLADITTRILDDVNLKRKRLIPSMDVILSADELTKLPEECIHTLQLRVTPNMMKLYTEE